MKLDYSEFLDLYTEWRQRNAGLSFERGDHPNCLKILQAENKMDIIGFTALQLDGRQQAFHLLWKLVDERDRPPFDPYYAGRIPVLLECWRYWALKEGFLRVCYDPQSYWVEDKYGNRGDWH